MHMRVLNQTEHITYYITIDIVFCGIIIIVIIVVNWCGVCEIRLLIY